MVKEKERAKEREKEKERGRAAKKKVSARIVNAKSNSVFCA